MSAAKARQNQPKKRSLQVVNEHFEPNFNAASASTVVFQQPAKPTLPADDHSMTREVVGRIGLGYDSEFQLAQTQHHIHQRNQP
jgi:hypothetical protein